MSKFLFALNCFFFIGIRGEIYLIVRVEIFTDAAKYKQSSCGVDFFSCKNEFFFVLYKL